MSSYWRLALLGTMLLPCLPGPVVAQTEAHGEFIAACTAINHDYALARDRADKDRFAALFTEDAVFTIQGAEFVGRDRIASRVEPDNAGNFARLLVTSIDISPIDAQTATGVTYFIMFMASGDPTPPISAYTLFMGEYHDRYAMTPDGCKFTRRETVPLFAGERAGD